MEEENHARIHSARMRRIKQIMETLEEIIKGLSESLREKDGSKAMETKVQEILDSTEELKESINSMKEMELLRKERDQTKDREKMTGERKKSFEKSSDCNNKTASCKNELAADRTPNALEPVESPRSVDTQRGVKCIDRATSPVELMQSKFEVKNGTPTDDELEQLGDEIAEKWKKLGRRLGVSEARRRDIEQAHDQLSEKGYHMLKHWQQKKGSDATYQALSDALQHERVQRKDLAERFCYIKGKEVVETDINRARIHSTRLETLKKRVKSQGISVRLISPQEEIVVIADRIPNALGRDDNFLSPDIQENFSFLDKATLVQSKLEGNQTCLRCRELEEKLIDIKNEKEQLQLKYNREKQDWVEKETGKKNREAKLREAIDKLKRLDPVRVNELEQENEILRKQKNEIEVQFRSDKGRMEGELESSKEILEDLKQKRVKAVRGKQRLKNENETFRKQIEDLEKKNKALETKNNDLLSKVNGDGTSECENLRVGRDQFSSEMERLRNEIDESQLKCRKLEEEIIKWSKAVGRIFQPSGRDFSSSATGVVSALKKDNSAKLVATRSSDGKGEARDIFKHKNGRESGTDAKKDSWWCVDLGENCRLFITHCALRHGKENDEAVLKSWKIQGSIDGREWTDLKKSLDTSGHVPSRVPKSYSTRRWRVEGEVGAFRYFRIWQTGVNSSSEYGIYLSGVELYGTLIKM